MGRLLRRLIPDFYMHPGYGHGHSRSSPSPSATAVQLAFMVLQPLERLVEALSVLYLGFLAIDSTYRLLMKTTGPGGVLCLRNPGWRWLAVGAGIYLPLCCFVGGGGGRIGGVVAAETFGDYLVEATKLLLLAEASKLAWRRWCGNWVGAGRALRARNGTIPAKTEKPAPAPTPPSPRPQSRKVEKVAGEKAEGETGEEDKVVQVARVETEEAVELGRLREQRIRALEPAATEKRGEKAPHKLRDRTAPSLLDVQGKARGAVRGVAWGAGSSSSSSIVLTPSESSDSDGNGGL